MPARDVDGSGDADELGDADESDDSNEPGDVDGSGVVGSWSAARRRRLRSAVLWGVVGGLSTVVLVQTWLLVGGSVPLSYGGVVALAGGIAVMAGAVTFGIEHRIARKRSKRRT